MMSVYNIEREDEVADWLSPISFAPLHRACQILRRHFGGLGPVNGSNRFAGSEISENLRFRAVWMACT